MNQDHAHFLVQTMPIYRPSEVVQKQKSLIAREVFAKVPEVRKQLWGGAFWGEVFFINTVGQHGNEKTIAAYVKEQGSHEEYRQLHKAQMLLDLD